VGTYDVTDSNTVVPMGSLAYLSLLLLTDGGVTPLAYAASGTVTLTGVGSNWAGHFDSQLINPSDGGAFGALSGTFDAPVCSP
jgi:hypothetical protein